MNKQIVLERKLTNYKYAVIEYRKQNKKIKYYVCKLKYWFYKKKYERMIKDIWK